MLFPSRLGLSPVFAYSLRLATWLGGACLLHADETPVDGNLDKERWNNVVGQDLRTVLDSGATVSVPSVTSTINLAETTPDDGNGFLVRLRGRLVAPVAGEYRFQIASNDQSELWLGTGEGKFTKRKIASVPLATGYRVWATHASQDSGLITLAAGQSYYFEVLMHDAGSSDHLSIGWVRPGQTEVEVIPGKLADETVILKRFVVDPLDLDDDDLPDAWESQVGLDTADNGQVNPANGPYGDADGDGFNNLTEWLTGGNPFAVGGNAGYVNRDIWTGLTGNAVKNLTGSTRFPKPSDDPQLIASDLDFGTQGDNYGQKISGMIVPPYSGNWRFWIASDGGSDLHLSNSSTASGKRRIARVDTATSSFDTATVQKSEVRALTAGVPYYFDVLHKEATGADHAKVAWAFEPPASAMPANQALASNGAIATQSSTLDVRVAARGNDGIINTSYETAHTANLSNSWWQVDLGQNKPVSRVVLFNRTDTFKTRFSNFRVSVLDASNNEVAGQDFYTTSGYVEGSVTWQLPTAVTGRKVKVRILGLNLQGNGYLSVAEAQVFSEWPDMVDRRIVAAPYLRTAVADPLDQDGDSLQDAWELAHGLNPADNGAIDMINGEYGDPDGDFHTNRDEFIAGTDPRVQNPMQGKFRVETWRNVSGYSVSDLIASSRIYGASDICEARDLAALLTFSGEYLGSRTRGYITPATTGTYTFWLSARTSAELWLSTNDSLGKYAKKRLAILDSTLGTSHGVPSNASIYWDVFASQKSASIQLVAGRSYYIEIVHQHGHSAGAHSSVAWALNDGARVCIPSAVSSTYIKTADDQDDDYLPDTWETQYGLDTSDNGASDPAKQGERGDFDNDGLTNREEYLLGINPVSSDTDGDGLSDLDEVSRYGTSPTVSNTITGEVVDSPPLTSYNRSGTSSNWYLLEGGLVGNSFRGKIEWSFTVPNDGWWVVDLEGVLRGSLRQSEELNLGVKIDGKSLAQQTVRFLNGQPAGLKVSTPYLQAGTHKFSLDIRNDIGRRTFQIQSLRVSRPGGFDSDSNGRPDWLDALLAQANVLVPVIGESPVSPLFIEGSARYLGGAHLQVSGQPTDLQRGLGDFHWFGNVPLSATGSTPVNVTFENSSHSVNVVWSRWNAMSGQGLTIRLGDSVKIGGWLTTTDNGTVQITVNGQSQSIAASGSFVNTFTQTGTFPVSVTHSGGGQSTAVITVVAANFGEPQSFYTDNVTWRSFPDVPPNLKIVTDPTMTVDSALAQGTGQKVLLRVFDSGPHTLAARIGSAGPIVALGSVTTIGISDALRNDAPELLGKTSNGYNILRTPIVVTDLPVGGRVVLTIFRAGVTFLDGTTVKTLTTADFINGVAYLEFRFPPGLTGGYCHYIDVYDAQNRHLGRR